MNRETLVEIKNLSVDFSTAKGALHVLRDVSLSIPRNRVVGLVGESGSGKSTLALALLGLLPDNTGEVSGRIELDGENLLDVPPEELRRLRGGRIAMIFQDPMTSLNPVFSIGTQLVDAQRNRHPQLGRRELLKRADEMLKRVGISNPEARLAAYPHQLSGGMRQRVMIAMALLCEPDILIADEPTTALDVTIEAQIVRLLDDLRADFSGSIVLVSHSLGLISELCDEVAVMYAGKVVESAPTKILFGNPRHPYTLALLACEIDPEDEPGEALVTIKGGLPDLIDVPKGCIFAARCPSRFGKCVEEPPLCEVEAGHKSACWLA
ncbi:ABC transporter ATP-binding protein [Mesorhizobium sp. LHD-90]|uniref:ABC transporter ATP-binding protein n=1 Tax=Mesorhizobium sp. LHD-90 TaxID=3071414 RepID=UPI0027E19B8F|nr:ABC transporter ATP-binding protein [Mesorhizobium sp. LHD-90]MDQ6433269.1 ABC transporter ATP-binding protein [Mesorhizobium sp. LHD-90]